MIENEFGLSPEELEEISKSADSLNNIFYNNDIRESSDKVNIEDVMPNTNTDTDTETITLLESNTNTNQKTNTNTGTNTSTNTITLTNTVSEDNSEDSSVSISGKNKNEGKLIDIRKDIDFEKNDYSPKRGLSFVRIYDTSVARQVKRIVNNNSMNCYITKADIISSPEGFEEDNTYLILTDSATKPFYDTIIKKEHKKNVYCIIYRATKFKFGFKEVTEEMFEELLSYKDNQIFDEIIEFKKMAKRKVEVLIRNPEQLNNLILKLIEGKEDKSIMESSFNLIIKEGVNLKFSDEDLEKASKTYYGVYFDKIKFDKMLKKVKEELKSGSN